MASKVRKDIKSIGRGIVAFEYGFDGVTAGSDVAKHNEIRQKVAQLLGPGKPFLHGPLDGNVRVANLI